MFVVVCASPCCVECMCVCVLIKHVYVSMCMYVCVFNRSVLSRQSTLKIRKQHYSLFISVMMTRESLLTNSPRFFTCHRTFLSNCFLFSDSNVNLLLADDAEKESVINFILVEKHSQNNQDFQFVESKLSVSGVRV